MWLTSEIHLLRTFTMESKLEMLIWLFKCILTKLIWIANRAFIQLFSLFKDSICYSWLILLTFSPLFPVDILIWFGFVVAAELLFWDGVFRNWHANPKEIISNPHEIISWVWYLGWPASGALQSHVLSSILPPTSAASSFHPGSIKKSPKSWIPNRKTQN